MTMDQARDTYGSVYSAHWTNDIFYIKLKNRYYN